VHSIKKCLKVKASFHFFYKEKFFTILTKEFLSRLKPSSVSDSNIAIVLLNLHTGY
jgi:hypothetical protein